MTLAQQRVDSNNVSQALRRDKALCQVRPAPRDKEVSRLENLANLVTDFPSPPLGNHFDHSSLDSLLDPAFPPEDDLARQSGTEGLSLTNLSHDSGLTTSDSQLYAFEEPENSFR